jgi:predicted tellurium resistance membrane protein TerC
MNLRTTLLAIEIASFAIAVVALFVVLFVVGNTLYIEETARPAVTAVLAILVGVGALVGAIIHGVGVPTAEKSPEESGKKKSR